MQRLGINRRWVGALVAVGAVGVLAAAAWATTSVKPYAVPIGSEYAITPLLSANDEVALTGNASMRYRMVGIPDGLGAHANWNGTSTLYMNHEFGSSALSEPVVGGPKNRGAIVSKWILDRKGNPISGARAYDTVYEENTLVGPAADDTNTTRPFARFCSGFLAGPANGFDRWIYMPGEESDGPDTFDGKGGLSAAIFDGELHTLPRLGRFAKENQVVQAGQGSRTVVFPMEDGPSAPDSQLWMYVGKKDRGSESEDEDDDDSKSSDKRGSGSKPSVLARNGLDNGSLYVFRSLDSSKNSELGFQSGSVEGEWIEIPGAQNLTSAELEAAADKVGAMTFIRPEDSAFNKLDRNELFFVTTGGNKAEGNELGRLYSLQLHPGNVLENASLTVAYNADAIVAAGGDTALSPDNIDTSYRYLMINEDGTTQSRAVMAAKGRDGSIWRYEVGKGKGKSIGVDGSTAKRIAQLNPPGRDGIAVGPGVWETSGIIDAPIWFGADAWLSDVQAHSPTTAPGGTTVTVEDGQLFLMRPAR